MIDIRRAWLTTNRNCNNHCEWCYAQNAGVSSMELVSAKRCIDIFSELNVKTVVLIGGEPTLYKHIYELLKYIRNKNIRTALTTNGRKFSEDEFARKICETGIESINISIKATSEEKYIERTKDNGLYEAIIGYHNLIKYGFTPTLSYVISNGDKSEIDDLLSLMRKNNLQNIIFQFAKPVIAIDGTEILPISEMAKITEYIYRKMQNENISYMIELSYPFCALDDTIREKLLKEKRINSCCHVQSGKGIVIDTDLKILPCNHFVGSPYDNDIICDSSESIIKVFTSENAIKFRSVARRYPSHKCIDCRLWDVCGGGCFTRWLFTNPESSIPGIKDIKI